MESIMRNLVASLAFLATLAGAQAQETYPSKNVRIIVPNPPGGVTDILARVIAASLQNAWGKTVIVENKPGADDLIGAEFVVRSEPDGHTLLVISNSVHSAGPHIHKDMRFDPAKDLMPLVLLGSATPVMNVPAASPAKTVRDFIAMAKEKPGFYNYASMGNGTYPHIAMEDFKIRAGVNIQHVPYRGATPAITALLQNEVSSLIVNMSNVSEFVKAGQIRVIAAAGAQRSAMFPDLPTVAESGVPGFATGNWWGMFAPAGLPPAIVEKIRADVNRALSGPEAEKLYATQTLERINLKPEQYAAFMREDFERHGAQIRAADVKKE
jgi:tripartite-type tricarboxylate transporter receptor subunit TctC